MAELPDFSVYFPSMSFGTLTSTAIGTNNAIYVVPVILPHRTTLTGVTYRVGGASAGSVRCALYTISGGTLLAARTSNVAQAAINTVQQVAFDAPLAINPQALLAGIQFTTSTATFMSAAHTVGVSAFSTPGAMGPPSTVTPTLIWSTNAPIVSTY